MQGSDYLEEIIRPEWAIFEEILIRHKKKRIISKKTLSNYRDKLNAFGFRINDEEISKMLVYFHRVGTVLYLDEEDDVILDIQWFLDAFKCIISYSMDIEGCYKKREHFIYNGELDDEELNRIWKLVPEKGLYLNHKHTILAYMEHFGLLAACRSHEHSVLKSVWYYVPRMNNKIFDKHGEGFSKSSILCFKFDDEGSLPINVFYNIVLRCSNLPGWSILRERGKLCMYDNAACFLLQENIVVLCICNFEIQVQVWGLLERKDNTVLEGIKKSVEKIFKEHTKYSYKIGYKCQNAVINAMEYICFIEESEFPISFALCRTCDIDKKHLVSNDICWVG